MKNLILITLLVAFLVSCKTVPEMSEEEFNKQKTECEQKANDWLGASMDDLIRVFNQPVYSKREIDNTTIIVFNCPESLLYLHFYFDSMNEIKKVKASKYILP